ncbi:uncharacterized protein SOCG_00182 [Schizosaccharomyces octosporus yFS286]|uniref:Uncharacterized protein n=1 Tax=Schizosaccharomyces octosporus (strain yFS286) TaxID=483514 RepID=S9REB7_SCHOY|nr:uncharacterized protein SOCG_00182 [Schizosaccharomyces octosporus yFS286]EPX72419.1 hypothetical protein SOCG_00182 [Schizosaccharomyces octosporus yFS286]
MAFSRSKSRLKNTRKQERISNDSSFSRESVRFKHPPLSRNNLLNASHSSQPIIRHSSVKTDRPHFQRASTLVPEQSSEILNDAVEEPVNDNLSFHETSSVFSSPSQSVSVQSAASPKANSIYDNANPFVQSELDKNDSPLLPSSRQSGFSAINRNELDASNRQERSTSLPLSSHPERLNSQPGVPRLPVSRLNRPVPSTSNGRNRIVSEVTHPPRISNEIDNYNTRSVSLPLHQSVLDNTFYNSHHPDDESSPFAPVEDIVPFREYNLGNTHLRKDSRHNLLDYGSSSSSMSSTSGARKPVASASYTGNIAHPLSQSENASEVFSTREILRNRSSNHSDNLEKVKHLQTPKESDVLHTQVKNGISRFMVFFTVGIIFPPLWVIASFLPIPGSRTYRMQWKHIYWRFINRVVSCLGIAIVFLFIGLGIAGA